MDGNLDDCDNDYLRHWPAVLCLVYAVKVKILGIEYPIRFIHPNITMDSANLGECDLSACEIRLNNQQSTDLIRATLLHEIIEALNFRMELELEHQKINQIEAGLFQVFCDSPKVARFIFGGAP